MESDPEFPQRGAFRFTLPCHVSYEIEGETAHATVLNVSLVGVGVGNASKLPFIGTTCRSGCTSARRTSRSTSMSR